MLDLSPAPDALYYGSTLVDRLYVGATLVYQRVTGAALTRLPSGNVQVNSVPAAPSLQLTRLGSGNVQVESA